MGRWIEILNKEGEEIEGTSPIVLIRSVCYLPKDAKKNFPVLSGLDPQNDKYIDEIQILEGSSLKNLLNELSDLRDLTTFKKFIQGVDNSQFYVRWKNNKSEEHFQDELNGLIALIKKAMDIKLAIKISL